MCFLTDVFIPTDNNVSIKEYNKTSNYKDLEIEIEKTCGSDSSSPGYNRKNDRHIRYLAVPAYVKYKKMHFAELLVFE